MVPPHSEFNDDHKALAYFITFRTYGTWLHGDKRGSVDRFHNRYGSPRLPPNKLREKYSRSLLKRPPVRLTGKQRKVVRNQYGKPVRLKNGTYGLVMLALITCIQWLLQAVDQKKHEQS